MRKTFGFDQVFKHNKTQDCWVIIQGKVYDVTPFMEDHPGGAEVLLAATGKDATADFEDIGHSDDAKGMMDKYYIGDLLQQYHPATALPPPSASAAAAAAASSADKKTKKKTSLLVLQILMPLFIFSLAFAVRSYAKH